MKQAVANQIKLYLQQNKRNLRAKHRSILNNQQKLRIIIEKTITKYGCKPIQNLSGHSLERYTIHAGKSIPNIWTIGHSFNLSVNNVYAIEPFLTTKDGQGVF